MASRPTRLTISYLPMRLGRSPGWVASVNRGLDARTWALCQREGSLLEGKPCGVSRTRPGAVAGVQRREGPGVAGPAAEGQSHGGQPLSKMIFQPSGPRRQIELYVPMRLPAGSRTGPVLIPSVPESFTSTRSGSHEKASL